MYIHHYQHVHDWKLNLEHPNIELLFQTEKKDRSSTCGGFRRFQLRKQTSHSKINYAFGCLNMVINIPRRRNILHIRQINGTRTVIEMELYKEFKMVGFCVFYFLFAQFLPFVWYIYWIEAAGPNMFNPRLFLWLCFHFHLVSVGFWCLSLSL